MKVQEQGWKIFITIIFTTTELTENTVMVKKKSYSDLNLYVDLNLLKMSKKLYEIFNG